ncbi:hypothetical protein Lser_V15G07902 [Lactuca serriola]
MKSVWEEAHDGLVAGGFLLAVIVLILRPISNPYKQLQRDETETTISNLDF